jgi:DNA repair protein RecO (recombination protein O)
MFYAVSRFEIVFVRDAFSGRKSNQKIAYFQPLTILEIEAVHKKQRHFRKFQGNKIASAFHSFRYLQKHHGDVYLEMLHHSIHEGRKRITFTF